MRAFDLENDSAFRQPTKEEIRAEKNGEYNRRTKNMMRFIGENLATYAVVLATTLLVGSVFGEMSFNFFSGHMLMDFILTVSVYMLVEYLLSQNGVRCGKTYDEYILLHKTYLNMRETIYKRGIALMDMFCDWQVDVEYEYYMRRRCKKLKINYREYCEIYSKLSLEELSNMFTHRGDEKAKFTMRHPIRSAVAVYRAARVSNTAKNIFYLRSIRPIELTPEILLTDGKPRRTRGGVGISGEEHVERKTVGVGHIIVSVVTALISVLPVIVMREWSWMLLFYAAMRLVGVFFRGSRGYANGARAFNTVEVKHLQDKIQYFHLYNEFLDKKIYMKIGEKYGDYSVAVNEDNYQCE